MTTAARRVKKVQAILTQYERRMLNRFRCALRDETLADAAMQQWNTRLVDLYHRANMAGEAAELVDSEPLFWRIVAELRRTA